MSKQDSNGRTHIFRFKINPNSKQVIAVECPASFATKAVTINRTTEHFLRGKKGQGMECADLVCAKAHKSIFKKIGVNLVAGEFSRTRFYAIDKVAPDGLPLHCTIFGHDDPTIGKIDAGTLPISEAPRTIRLFPPDRRLGYKSPKQGKKSGTLSKPHGRKGAFRRLIDSGDIAAKTLKKLKELNATR